MEWNIEIIMAFLHLMVMTIWISYGSSRSVDNGGCHSPQYLKFGGRDIIQCSFRMGYYGILWYNTTEIEVQDPVVELVESSKSGKGYTSEEYDIYPNGSLIINNVSSIHDQNFTVVKFDSLNEEPMQFVIAVVTVVYPEHRQPVITRCEVNGTYCFTMLDSTSTIDCYCRKARPAVDLMWLVRTSFGDRNIKYQLNTTITAATYTSSVTTTDIFYYSRIMSLLVCRAKTLPGMLNSDESLILVQNKKLDIASVRSLKIYIALHSILSLVCTNETVLFLSWHKGYLHDDQYVRLVHAVFLEKQYTRVSLSPYKLSKTGSLVVPQVRIEQEGYYTCIYGDGLTNGITKYEVLVYTYPDPTHPLVEGCSSQQFCILSSSREGSLTCSVTDIRPKVLLGWTIGDELSEIISFEHQKPKVNRYGDTFNVTLTSLYRVLDLSVYRVIVKCQIEGPQMDIFKDVTTVELLIQDQHSGGNFLVHWKILIGIGIAFSCAVVAAFVIYKVILRKTLSKSNESSTEEEETPMIHISDTSAKFISQLKEMYGNIYNSVHPIPSKQDKFYSVNKLFVTGGIEVLKSSGNAISDVWEKKVSYKEVFKDETTRSMKYIVQGKAGYGKSTLMLQLVHDWCKNDLHDKNVLIFLRLRELTGEMTIFEAIKRFTLPGDSDFSVRNIESILVSSGSSVVIILDGFDEYPDKDKDSDILKIIRRDMLSHCKIVLTTRPGYLHEKYSIQAQRIRLTGFDNQAQKEYIKKVIGDGKNEPVDYFQRRLRAHGALSKLSSVPLIFAAFVHMSYERGIVHKTNCLTTILDTIVSIFHSHVKNKNKDNKVSDYQLFAKVHEELDKVAFDAILLKKKEWKWSKNDLCKQLDPDFCNYYICTGIMVEKDENDDVAHLLQSEQIQHDREVTFTDNILCEWYAAHHLVGVVLQRHGSFKGSFTDDGKEKKLYVHNFHQVYRIACGMDNTVAKAVIQYLKTTSEANMLIQLCRFESDKNRKHLQTALKKTCRSTILFRKKDSLALQSSSFQVLYIAASCDIPIQCVKLIDSYKAVNLFVGYLLLESDIRLSSLSTLLMLWLDDRELEMEKKQFEDLLKFSCSFPKLKSLKFSGILLPSSLKDKDVRSLLKTRNLSVFWDPRYTSYNYRLNFESGKWEHGCEVIDYQSELSRWLKRFIT